MIRCWLIFIFFVFLKRRKNSTKKEQSLLVTIKCQSNIAVYNTILYQWFRGTQYIEYYFVLYNFFYLVSIKMVCLEYKLWCACNVRNYYYHYHYHYVSWIVYYYILYCFSNWFVEREKKKKKNNCMIDQWSIQIRINDLFCIVYFEHRPFLRRLTKTVF